MEEFMPISRNSLGEYDAQGRPAEGACLVTTIADRLAKERELRPRFAKSSWDGLAKLRHALNMLEEGVMRGETNIATAQNALILIASAIRFLNREWKCDD